MNKNRIINITLATLLFLGVLTVITPTASATVSYSNNFNGATSSSGTLSFDYPGRGLCTGTVPYTTTANSPGQDGTTKDITLTGTDITGTGGGSCGRRYYPLPLGGFIQRPSKVSFDAKVPSTNSGSIVSLGGFDNTKECFSGSTPVCGSSGGATYLRNEGGRFSFVVYFTDGTTNTVQFISGNCGSSTTVINGDNLSHHYDININWATSISTITKDGGSVLATLDFGVAGCAGLSTNINELDFGITGASFGANAALQIDNIVLESSGLNPAAISSSLTSISGFDITLDGTGVITRSVNGANQDVKTFDGNDLTLQYTDTTTCNRAHGVVGLGDNGFAYLTCLGGGSPDTLKFINPSGSGYPFSPACNQPHYNCDSVLSVRGSGITTTDRDALSDLVPIVAGEAYTSSTANSGIVTGFNLVSTESSSGASITDLNMGWSLDTGGATTTEHFHSVPLGDTTNLASDVCGYGNLRAFRSVQGSPVKGYTVTLNNNPSSSGDQIPASTFVQTFTGSSNALLTGTFIDCANDRIIVDSSTELTIWNYATNSLVLTKAITGGSYNTISGNGSYAAYSDGTLTHIISGSTGNDLAFISNPGTLIDMEMDRCAQNIFLATATNVYRYNITANTTVTPVDIAPGGGCNVSSGITPTSSGSSTFGSSSNGISIGGSSTTITNPFHASDDNPFGLNITYISTQLHVSHEGVAVMIGLIFVVIFTIWLWRGTGSPIIALLGAGLGLVVATLFGFINVWVIMVVVLFLVVMLGKMLFGGFTGGEES